LRFLLDSVQIGDWEIDLQTGDGFRSLPHDRCFGYDTLQPSWSMDIFVEHVLAEDRAHVAAQVRRAIEQRTEMHFECRVIWPDRSTHWIRVDGSVKTSEGTGERLIGIVMDITRERLAGEQQRRVSSYTRSLIEACLDPLVAIDTSGKITDVNEASVEATGVPRETLVGGDFCDYFTAPEQAREGYRRAFSHGLVRDYPLTMRHASGRVIDVLYNAAVYRDEFGAVQGVLAAARDITEIKRLGQVLEDYSVELEKAKSVAEKASLAKSDFLSSMSHELRSPLNAILGFAQLLESGVPALSDPQRSSIEQISRAGWYLLELINEVLDLATVESGNHALSLESICLRDLLRDCREMIEPLATQRGIALEFPDGTAPWLVWGDRMRIKQIVINLLSNAIKYNRSGGRVQVSCTGGAGDAVRVGFRDSGLGLSAREMGKLFEPFNRLGREGGAEEGTGIGLVVTKRLVEMMSGRIGVESALGVGSFFWVELPPPAAQSADDRAPAIAAAAFPLPAPVLSQLRTLLCVEDNPANLSLVERMLERRDDIRVLAAQDAIQGVALARTLRPDVILMDINLPAISGFSALEMLAQDPGTAHIPVIALSALAMPRDIERGTAAGFFHYLTKPVKLDEFLAVVDSALRSGAAAPVSPTQRILP
jgi:PAS domain S-box-containing protein